MHSIFILKLYFSHVIHPTIKLKKNDSSLIICPWIFKIRRSPTNDTGMFQYDFISIKAQGKVNAAGILIGKILITASLCL